MEAVAERKKKKMEEKEQEEVEEEEENRSGGKGDMEKEAVGSELSSGRITERGVAWRSRIKISSI